MNGKFVTTDAVADRFEGTFPSDRSDWLAVWIPAVENELISEVPSLATIDVTADPYSTDPVIAAVGRRVERVKTLVIDKLLDMFRNPDGAVTVADSMDGISSSRSYSGRLYAGTRGSGISFTEDELNRVRLRKTPSPKLGTYGVSPWPVG